MVPETPSRDGCATVICPVCASSFVASPKQRYCSHACRSTAWRRRRHVPVAAEIVVPPGRSKRALSVYECEACGVRSVGEQRCEGCGSFMRRVGLGGCCPHCDEAVAVIDLLDEEVVPKAMR